MSEYIGLERSINVIKSPYDGDIFDFMAGGLFDDTYAGGVNYHPLMLPSPNMKSLFMERSVGKTLQLLRLQEDFVEYALMPLQMYDYLSEKEISIIVNLVAKSVDSLLTARYGISVFHDGNAYNGGFGGVASGIGVSLDAVAREMTKDSLLEDAFGQLGARVAGPLGRALAESLYDGITTGDWSAQNFGANLVETTTKGLVGQAVNRATAGLVGAMGVKSPAAATVLGMVVGAFVTEALEVALGLDNHFGFGGQFVGTNVNGERVYTKAKTLEEVWHEVLQSVGLAESSLSPGAPGSYNSGYGLSNDYNDGGAFGDNNLDNDETSDSLGSELGGMQTGPNGEEGMDPDNPGWDDPSQSDYGGSDSGGLGGGGSANEGNDGASAEAGNSEGGAGTNAGGGGGLQR